MRRSNIADVSDYLYDETSYCLLSRRSHCLIIHTLPCRVAHKTLCSFSRSPPSVCATRRCEHAALTFAQASLPSTPTVEPFSLSLSFSFLCSCTIKIYAIYTSILSLLSVNNGCQIFAPACPDLFARVEMSYCPIALHGVTGDHAIVKPYSAV